MATFACSLPSSTLSSFPSLQSLQFPRLAPPCRRRAPQLAGGRLPPAAGTVRSASRREDAYGSTDSGGWLVDEDMVVLRKRLYEMEVAEKNYEPPSQWMEWEKRYHHGYTADVFQIVGLLQALLMNTRPSVALAVLALVAFSVPASAGVVVLNLISATKAVLADVHLG